VLAIERNRQNKINITSDAVEGASEQVNGSVSTIVDEYKQLALYDIFKGIVAKLVPEEGTAMQA
jgi:mannose/fructose/N-acetylgalactosamine-specific phosphotransferase system component IID